MRIYLPLTAQDRTAVQRAASGFELPVGRVAWAVSAAARADRPGEDEEDLEYDALQDAVHIAYSTVGGDSRAFVVAADVPDGALETAGEGNGAFGVVTRESARAKIASFHVTELDADAAAADDTDPAVLWFDVSEGVEALNYLDRADAD